ncbi:type I restriction endonuclease [uncultured Methanobacterium sp.]|uniref:type I restriction endonuclease subunit R n=1 Tax=uncultured Methanobacterium sp. TaxID=176306 RepID=UPI002AA73D0D|nr:type I restriction endonuclease [uncultured Methanobacterium sp.]
MTANTSEKRFQEDIIVHLESTGYLRRNTHQHYEKSSCLDPELTLKFIQNTQLKEWEKWQKIYGSKAEQKFFFRLVSEIDNKGTIHVLRNGFKDASCYFDLFYPQPNNSKNPDLFLKYEGNIFSVIDELEYQDKENGNRIDLTIFINGLPISTIELKDTFSQGVERAMEQYRKDRDPREKIFKRCLVHFAMSNEMIFMSTKLEGHKTLFLPFNKDLENPVVKNDYNTCYLYNDILQKNKLSKLISNFIYIEEDDKKEIPIFPRYHQLDCVNRLLADSSPGRNYLIEHSAGSGKTKTIAWLAHGLVNKFNSRDDRVYDMVVVVSDRRVIDQQLQVQVKAIEKTKGVVEVIDKDAHQLGEALKTGSNIVVTTLHKFPYILEEVSEMPTRKYAVIIDEAHSSQTGTMARKMKQVLSTNSLKEAEFLDDVDDEVEEEILKELESFRNLDNISFFAFTATPKAKTLEMFGTMNEIGEFEPFHTYTMKQAIDEGFILDVLKHYLTYPTYFKLVKTIEDDPKFEERKAKRLLRNFVEKHPHAILMKTEIMLDHFMNSTQNKIKGRARAMVVTRSRLHAVFYKQAFDNYIKKNGYPIKTLVAFTGTVKHDEQEYTENSMNDLPPKKTIENAFVEDPYRILIVANKYQTGFDQPLLHTMYVDKSLNGIAAVQTLSRVNRIYRPHKTDTLILDFANKTETIQKAFKPYYETTFLTEATDPHKLYELWDKLIDYHVFDQDDVDTFVIAYRKGETQPELHNILSPVVNDFKKLEKEDQIGFKKTLRRYQNIYSFLSQLIPFSDVNLEKLFIFNKFLNKKLPTINDPLPFNVLEDVDMDSYKILDKDEISIQLESDGELKPASNGAAVYPPDEQAKLSEIIKDLNDAFGTEFTDDDRVFLERVKANLLGNDDLVKKMEHNSPENVKAVFDKYFNQEMTGLLNSNMEFYKRVVDNDKLREKLKLALFDLLYEEFGE